MTRRTQLLIAALVGIAVVAGTAAHAQGDTAGQLRASGHVGEQADGYLGLVDAAPADLRAQMEQVNIQRRAAYTQLASQRNATIEEVAAATACQLFATRRSRPILSPARRRLAPPQRQRAGPAAQSLRIGPDRTRSGEVGAR